MSRVSRHTTWASYGPCDTCTAGDGEPCWDLRRNTDSGSAVAKRPHSGRHVRGYLPPHREDAR